MANGRDMEGYRPPTIVGVQQGENLLPIGWLPLKEQHRSREAAEFAPFIPKKWPPDNIVKPVIPTKYAFDPLQYEHINAIFNRYGIL